MPLHRRSVAAGRGTSNVLAYSKAASLLARCAARSAGSGVSVVSRAKGRPVAQPAGRWRWCATHHSHSSDMSTTLLPARPLTCAHTPRTTTVRAYATLCGCSAASYLQRGDVVAVSVRGEAAEVADGRQRPHGRLARAHPVQRVELRLDVDHRRAVPACPRHDVHHGGEDGAVAVPEEGAGHVTSLHVVLQDEPALDAA